MAELVPYESGGALTDPGMREDDASIQEDLAAIDRIAAVPALLRVLCETTGMGFAAVARVTADSWIACAVQDDIKFGLTRGGRLDVNTTLCKEVRELRVAIAIDHASADPLYCNHHTPQLYSIESYVSVPIVLEDGSYFGNLCAIDPRPAKVSEPRILNTFKLFAQLIALELDNERKRTTTQRALLDERAAGELREQFIAVLGHDLRNPLSAIGACAHLAQRKAGDPEVVKGLTSKIVANVRRMTKLIDEIGDFARGRLGGGINLGSELVTDLDEALLQVVAELRDTYPDRVVNVNVAVRAPVHCDRGRVQQMVSNLLANTLTHGASDRPVSLTAVVKDSDLVIEVLNYGEPIPAASLPKIFEPFRRHSSSNHQTGLGLGLYICDQIVRAHRGQLQVTSTREGGTKFIARLPQIGSDIHSRTVKSDTQHSADATS